MGSAPAGNGHLSRPGARLAFRVGLVGHRPNRLPRDAARLTQLRQTIYAILDQLRREAAALSQGPVLLSAITPLAEGSDRIFAGEALALGYALNCPMPFRQEEFEKDFLPPTALEQDSLTRFRALLERARKGPGLTVLELHGMRAQAPEAYAAANKALVEQSDLLIAVWDGGPAAGHGGTVDAIQDALGRPMPVIWIDARAPDQWRRLSAMPENTSATRSRLPSVPEETIRCIVRAILVPQAPGRIDGPK